MSAEVVVTIGGRGRRLRFSRRSQFRAAQVNDSLRAGGAAAVAAMIWCLLDEANPQDTPEDIWERLRDDEVEDAAEAVKSAWEAGNRSEPGKPKKKRRSSASKSG